MEAEEGENSNEITNNKCTLRGKEFGEELKPLPPNLRNGFLEPSNSLPVIIGASLDEHDTSKLMLILKLYKGHIGHSIDYLKGINPNVCMHRIKLEDDVKSSREFARRLNPKLNE